MGSLPFSVSFFPHVFLNVNPCPGTLVGNKIAETSIGNNDSVAFALMGAGNGFITSFPGWNICGFGSYLQFLQICGFHIHPINKVFTRCFCQTWRNMECAINLTSKMEKVMKLKTKPVNLRSLALTKSSVMMPACFSVVDTNDHIMGHAACAQCALAPLKHSVVLNLA